jgi:hypothetical protein
MADPVTDLIHSTQQRYDAEDDAWYRVTWRQLAEERERELRTSQRWARLCSDLDRCEHGRHEGDNCSQCGGRSVGNRLIGHAPIGHTMDRHHIFVPARDRKDDASEWVVDGPCRDPEQAGTPCPINPARRP